MRVSRCYRLLRAKMRSGAAYRTRSVAPGDLAIFCPACPQPGVNVPPRDQWQEGDELVIICENIVTLMSGQEEVYTALSR